MKDGWTLFEYIEFLNHFFILSMQDYDYMDGGSTPNALDII